MTEEKHRVINGRNSSNAMKENETSLVSFIGFIVTPSMQGMEDTVWRVGCYNINPTTPNGQKFFILHMLVLPLIPITALVIQNSVTWEIFLFTCNLHFIMRIANNWNWQVLMSVSLGLHRHLTVILDVFYIFLHINMYVSCFS